MRRLPLGGRPALLAAVIGSLALAICTIGARPATAQSISASPVAQAASGTAPAVDRTASSQDPVVEAAKKLGYAVVENASVQNEADWVSVSLALSQGIEPRKQYADSPPRFIVDLPLCVVPREARKQENVTSAVVSQVQVAQHKDWPPTGRVVLVLKGEARCDVSSPEQGTGLVIRAYSAQARGEAGSSPPAEAASPSEATPGSATSPGEGAQPAAAPEPAVAPPIAEQPAGTDGSSSEGEVRAEPPPATVHNEWIAVGPLGPEDTLGSKEASPDDEQLARALMANVPVVEVPLRSGQPMRLQRTLGTGPPPDAAPGVRMRPGFVSGDFVNAPLINVFRLLAYQSNQDILVDSAAWTGQLVTLRFTEMPLEEALQVIAGLYNVGYRRVGRTYVIATWDKLAFLTSVDRPVVVQHPDTPINDTAARDILKLLVPSVTVIPGAGGATTQAAPRAGRLAPEAGVSTGFYFLVGPELEVTKAQAYLAAAAHVAAAGGPGTERVVTLQYAKASQLAPDVAAAFPTLLVLGNDPGGGIILVGTREDVDRAEAVIKQLDRAPGAVPVAPEERVTRPVPLLPGVDILYVSNALRQDYPATELEVIPHPEEQLEFITLRGTKAAVDSAHQYLQAIGATQAPAPAGAGAAGAPAPPTGPTMASAVLRPVYVSALDLASQLAGMGVTAVATSQPNFPPSVVVSGPPDAVQQVRELFRQIDTPPRQAQIEVVISDFSEELARNLGLTWNMSRAGISVAEDRTGRQGMQFGRFDRSRMSVASVLNAIQADTNSRILARPTVPALEGYTAKFLIGTRVLIRSTEVQAGGAVTQSVLRESVGVGLETNLRIDENGDVVMELRPQVSNIVAFTPEGLPEISTREANTKVRVKDGETVIIGGLIREEEVETMSRVPILSEIPLFGELFKNRETRKRPTQVLMLVTPHIIGAEAQERL